ncbi:TonB family protein [Sphingomonas sp. ST-64]|uniref:TonB family protein n=1 Tax=Sphingomonas plantiphila TaxID=3163295 RepID=A0ABW8YPF8_9SPHN
MIDFLAMLGAGLSAPLAADPAPLSPSGKWHVDWNETSCLALQSYGTDEQRRVLIIKPSLDGSMVRLILSGPGSRQSAVHLPVDIAGFKATALRFTPPKKKLVVYWIDLPRPEFDRIAALPAVPFKGDRIALTLSTTGFGAAIKALDSCGVDLRKHWNADEAGKASISVAADPTIRIERVATGNDYPTQARKEYRGGLTAVSLLIDDAGAIKDCSIEQSSGVATIDAQTCILLTERAKFRPARDASGAAIRSSKTLRFRWELGN